MKTLYKCLTCGKDFEGQECYHKIGKEKYCSKACYNNSHQLRPTRMVPRIKVTCLKCGKEFLTIQCKIKQGRGIFCSHACCTSYTHKGVPKPASRLNSLKAAEANKGRIPWNKNRVNLICRICNKPFNVSPTRSEAKYCSWECNSKSKTLITGLDHPLYTRQIRTCEWCGEERRVKPAKLHEFRFCSRQCQGAWLKSHCHSPTTPELSVANALDALNIYFDAEYRIGRYSCDFALPQYRLVIEADGDYWHSLPNQKATDIAKDKYLQAQGWQVLRFKECDIHSNLAGCLSRLSEYIESQSEGVLAS